MTYRLGIDVGTSHTTWATVAGGADGTVDSGSIESVLGVAADGQLVGGTALAGVTTFVRDFVPRLGESAPVMVGTTPYGAESLVARLVGTVLDGARARHGAEPLAVVLVHDDGLDPYRAGLLTEAARLAGVAPAAIALAPRSQAAASAGLGASAASGAAKAGWSLVPDPIAPAAGAGTALGVAGGAAAAATGVGAAALLSGGGSTASAAAPAMPAAGAAGTPLAPAGPAGTPLQPAGPTGTPLQPAGPTGTPIQPAGPTGTPIQPAGPTGTPLQPPAAGPTGAPIQPGAGPTGSALPGTTPPVSVTSGLTPPKPRVPRWVTVAAGGVAAVAVVAVIAVLATRGDDDTSIGPADTTVAVLGTDAAGNPVTTLAGSTDNVAPDTTTPGSEAFDLTPVLGTWLQPCEPYLSGDGASQGSMTVESPGPNQLNVVIEGGDAVTADCSGGFETAITVTYALTVIDAGTSGDVTGFIVAPAGDPTCESIEPAACGLALGVASAVPPAIGVDGSGQLVTSEADPAAGFPSVWVPFVEGSVRI
jgi:hypothetical protein